MAFNLGREHRSVFSYWLKLIFGEKQGKNFESVQFNIRQLMSCALKPLAYSMYQVHSLVYLFCHTTNIMKTKNKTKNRTNRCTCNNGEET